MCSGQTQLVESAEPPTESAWWERATYQISIGECCFWVLTFMILTMVSQSLSPKVKKVKRTRTFLQNRSPLSCGWYLANCSPVFANQQPLRGHTCIHEGCNQVPHPRTYAFLVDIPWGIALRILPASIPHFGFTELKRAPCTYISALVDCRTTSQFFVGSPPFYVTAKVGATWVRGPIRHAP